MLDGGYSQSFDLNAVITTDGFTKAAQRQCPRGRAHGMEASPQQMRVIRKFWSDGALETYHNFEVGLGARRVYVQLSLNENKEYNWFGAGGAANHIPWFRSNRICKYTPIFVISAKHFDRPRNQTYQ